MTDWHAVVSTLRAGALPEGAVCVSGDSTEGVFRVGGAAVKLAAPGHVDGMARECEAARWASSARVGPDLVATLPDVGALVTRFVDGGTLTVASMRAEGVLDRVATHLRAVHASAPLPWEQDLRGDLAYERDGAPSDFDNLEPRIWEALARTPAPRRPCHNDVHPANVFDAHGAVVLIDWAAAAMGEPAWDVAMLASSAVFDDAMWHQWLAAYGTTPAFGARARLLGIVADLYNLAWHTNRPGVDATLAALYSQRVQRVARDVDGWCAQL